MEQGVYQIQFDLYRNGSLDSPSKDLSDFVTTCKRGTLLENIILNNSILIF